mmetsp:Transcript_8629/g.21576  ORF Transcript_8629/g.21576 Transcript_8629/m.21576 type:complete len:116 (-) Transcript_8629:105-452(-)
MSDQATTLTRTSEAPVGESAGPISSSTGPQFTDSMEPMCGSAAPTINATTAPPMSFPSSQSSSFTSSSSTSPCMSVVPTAYLTPFYPAPMFAYRGTYISAPVVTTYFSSPFVFAF